MVDNNLKSGKLGDFIQYKNGKALEKYFSAIGKYKVISIGNYSKNSQFFDNGVRISEKYYNEIKPLIPHRNDLTMILNDKTSSGEIIGRTLLIEKDDTYVINQRTLCMTLRVNMYAKYMYYILNSKHIRKYIFDTAKPGTQIYINAPDVLSIPIKYTENIQEQIAIAEALSDMDNLISSLQKLIDKKKSIKQGAMQELLTGQKRLPGFDGKWIECTIGDVLSVGHGQSQHGIEKEFGLYPILATGGCIGYTDNFLWDEPSVLIGRKGTINKPQYIETPFWTIDTLFYTKIKEAYIAKFIFYKFCLIDWLEYNEASGVPSLSANIIENIKITMPDNKKEQAEIARILTDIETEIEQLERKLFKYQQIKQGMMQELLTGHIRLIDNGKET